MPYQAAKAVAATFCYEIRWALTPVFGNDFPSMCLHPKDPSFAKFVIDPAIVEYCTTETNRFRTEGASYHVSTPNMSPTAEMPEISHESQPWLKPRRARPADIESGYGTDTDQSDKCFISPQVSPRSCWPSVNRSLSPYSPRTACSSIMSSPMSALAPPRIQLQTSALGGYYDEPFRTKRTHSKVAFSDQEMSTRPQTAAAIPNDHGKSSGGFGDSGHSQNDLDAAQIMVSLSSDDRLLLPPTKRTRRGSTL
jgi:hypothetical protein